MSSYVLPGDVRDEALISILLGVQDQHTLSPLLIVTIALRAKEQPQLERHVEARQWRIAARFGTRKIVDPVATLLDDVLDLGKPVFSGVLCFERTSGAKTRTDNREDYGMKDRLKLRIEGAVDEYVSRKRSRHLLLLEWGLRWLSKPAGFGISIDTIAQLLPNGGDCVPYLLIGEMFRSRDLLQDGHAVVRPADRFVLSGSGASLSIGRLCHPC